MKSQESGGLRTFLRIAFILAALIAQGRGAQSLNITQYRTEGGGLALGWQSSVTGLAYTVQFQETVVDGVWRMPASLVPFPIATNEWVSGANTNGMGFYRVVGVPAATRGKMASATSAGRLSTLVLAGVFGQMGIPITPQYNVREIKLTYETITPWGARTLASGALLLPESTGQALPLLSYQHGTITRTNEAPSALELTGEAGIGIAFATSGYVVTMPDYLGLGSSPGLHPYHHARSEATASLDLLRAARAWCATNGFALSGRLFLSGYSQGGHATMALLKELETYHANEFTVTACAAMAGAYDLSGVTTEDFLSGRTLPNPYYFLYLLAAYQEVYRFAPTLADLLVAPYHTTLPPLLLGNSGGGQINAALPADPVQILKPDFVAGLRANPRHPMRLALQENDLYRWKPRAPLRLYHCAADQDVIFANSRVAYEAFQAAGATQVQLVDPLPAGDHGDCVQPSLLSAKAWFDSLR